jgi:YHS domain-containing protein
MDTNTFTRLGLALGCLSVILAAETCFYSVSFAKGDTYYFVSAGNIEKLDENEIVFRTPFLGKVIRGNDYRLSEPLFDSFKRKEEK